MNKKLKNLYLCYNCGIDLIKIDEEDIPARNLFVDSTKHGEIIKVPSCRRCNLEFSKTDDELRDVLAWSNDSITENQKLTKKMGRSLFMNKKVGYKRLSATGGKLFMQFNVGRLYPSHFKNFKGIFVWETGNPLRQHFKFAVMDNFSVAGVSSEIEKFSRIFEDVEVGVSGSKNIFEYRIAGFTKQLELVAFDASSKQYLYAAYLVYHQKIKAIVLASDNEDAINFYKMKEASWFAKFLKPKE